MKLDWSRLHRSVPPAFIPLFNCRDRYCVIWGGAGSGKSEFAGRKVIWRVCNHDHKYLCTRKHNVDVVKTVVPLIGAVLDEWRIPATYKQQPFHSFKIGLSDVNSEIICAGIDDPEKIKSIPGITGTWNEEATELELGDFLQLDLRLRGNLGVYFQHMLTFNPVLRSNWVHGHFFDAATGLQIVDDHVRRHKVGDKWITTHHSTYEDNPFLDADYTGVLESLAKASKQHYTVYKLGQWGALSGTVYYSFGRQHNVDDSVSFDEHLPIWWTHDFNIGDGKPMSSACCHLRREGGTTVLHVFDEIILDTGNTHDAVDEFRERYPDNAGVVVFGDAAGKARDTRSKTTDYDILRKAGFVQQDVPRKNPSVRDRHNLVNAALQAADGSVRIKIHPRCRNLIRGLETVTVKGGANYVEVETYEQHVTTALGYLVCRAMPIAQRVPSGQKYYK